MRRTALHWACQAGNVHIVELLVDHGADTKVLTCLKALALVKAMAMKSCIQGAFLMPIPLPCRSGVPKTSWISCTRSACLNKLRS